MYAGIELASLQERPLEAALLAQVAVVSAWSECSRRLRRFSSRRFDGFSGANFDILVGRTTSRAPIRILRRCLANLLAQREEILHPSGFGQDF